MLLFGLEAGLFHAALPALGRRVTAMAFAPTDPAGDQVRERERARERVRERERERDLGMALLAAALLVAHLGCRRAPTRAFSHAP